MVGGHGSEGADGAAANQVTGVDECRRAVREELRAGADLIKFTMDGARRVPGKAVLEFTQEEASAIVDEAHRLGVAAAAHTFQPETVAIALHAGADTIEHGLHLSPENIQTMVGNGTWLVPTVTVTHHIIAHGEREMRDSNEYGAQALAHARQAAATQEASFRAALDAGVRILAGTDTSSVAGGLDSLPGELDHMRSLGMSIDAVLRSATSSAAEALERVGELGVVAPGALADLLAVEGVPSDDLSCLRNPRLVVTNGRFLLPGLSTPPATSVPALLTMESL
jgi:imidazolonepropionase-like amidohydrolase